ncbi:MAG: hypothetical protein LCH58_12810 [Bacteroidetes bacterium]|nr:hypothetical protein [Bacteroidota bacterium]
MTTLFKFVGLLVGVALTFLSFLFFGRQQGTYQGLLIGGLITALTFYLVILFSKTNFKTKIFWTVILILFAVIQQLTEPLLIDTSYRIYIKTNKETLVEINKILTEVQGDITILNDTVSKTESINSFDIDKLRVGQKKLGVYLISKSGNRIYYGLWGFLDVRLGITYFIDKTKPDNEYRHLTNNWYH